MIGYLHHKKIKANGSAGYGSGYVRTGFSNAHSALLSLLILALACLGSVDAMATDWTGNAPSDLNDKNVYLYNVGTKSFLGKGGRWGTEADVSYEGTLFTLKYDSSTSTFKLQSHVKEENDNSTSNGYFTMMDGKNSEWDKGNFFIDRPTGEAKNQNIVASVVSNASSDSKFKVYNLTITPTHSSSSSYYNKKYYITAAADKSVSATTSANGEYSQWILVSEDDRREAFKEAEVAYASPVNATFLMYDFDFARNDNACSNWKTSEGSLSFSSNKVCVPSDAIPVTTTTYTYTSTHAYSYSKNSDKTHTDTFTSDTDLGEYVTRTCSLSDKHQSGYTSSVTYTRSTSSSTSSGYTYYIGNGYDGKDYTIDPITGVTLSDKHNLQREYGGKWTANIHGASGKVYQSIDKDDMLKNGYYTISCKAFTTSTSGNVRLWAAANSTLGDGSSDTQSRSYGYQAITSISEAPATYLAASDLLSSEGTTYDVSVRVYVSDYTKQQLTFGIYVDGADESAWTCFDDFAIQYAGDPKHNLVLDEDQTDGDYIKAQATSDSEPLGTSTMYLHRTMNAGKWNTLVLPVDVTVGNMKSAFGDNVRISEFKGATDADHPNRLIFEKINVNRDQSAEIAVKAGKLYLVKVDEGKSMPTGQEEVAVDAEDYKSLKYNSYYTFPGITFKSASDVKNVDYSAKIEGEKGAEAFGESAQVQFVGTYVKLGNDSKIPANSYVLAGQNTDNATAGLWYYRTAETASKGFRGWLQPVTGANANAKKFEYMFDDELYTLDYTYTGIQSIVDDLNARESSNIYNVNGQLVRANATSHDGLAKGVYIQNGKKFIVK